MGLTVLVMALITPLTVKSTRSMLQMQRLQPEMKRLQEKYKDDREKLNQELMAFYRENQINPLGGCLPLLAQMPVFIIMYQLLRGLTVRPGGLGSGAGQIVAQTNLGVETTPWILTNQLFTPEHLNSNTTMYKALSTTNDMNFFGMDLSLSAAQAVGKGLLVALPYLLLLAIMLATGLYQNRQLQARNTSGNVNPAAADDHEVHAVLPADLLLRLPGWSRAVLVYAELLSNRHERLHHAQHLSQGTPGRSHRGHRVGEVRRTRGTGKKTELAGEQFVEEGVTERKSNGSGGASTTTKAKPSTPGKSAKSQAAHKKTSGQSSTGGTTSSSAKKAPVNARRSGEKRRGPQTPKEQVNTQWNG